MVKGYIKEESRKDGTIMLEEDWQILETVEQSAEPANYHGGSE